MAVWAAYGRRTRQNILVGTIVFGLSVVIVHFTAMNSTAFAQLESPARIMPTMENGSLAILVTLSAFVICGTFLLSAVTFFGVENFQAELAQLSNPDERPVPAAAQRAGQSAVDVSPANIRIPYEREKKTLFIPSNEAAAIRAEGHYTFLCARTAKLFCPWSISEAETRLAGRFQRTHRSYLVNIEHVSGFGLKYFVYILQWFNSSRCPIFASDFKRVGHIHHSILAIRCIASRAKAHRSTPFV